MLSNLFPSVDESYTWFLYLGIFLFVTHITLYGFGIDLSYFGLLLIYLGWAKPELSGWFRRFLWFFIFLDIFATFRGFYNRWFKPEDEEPTKKNPTFRPKKEKEEEEVDA
jgi:hypothetical protein